MREYISSFVLLFLYKEISEQAPIAVDRKVYKVVDPSGSSVRFLLVAAGYLLLHSAISSFNPAVEIETEADAFDRVETAVEAAIPGILEERSLK